MTTAPSGARAEAPTVHGRRPLSTRLVAAVVGLLAAICLLIGLATHAAMRQTLLAQVDGQLSLAMERAARFGGAIGDSERDPLYAPGQAAGTLNARISGTTLVTAGVLDAETGERRTPSQADAEVLGSVEPGTVPSTRSLSFGDYRLAAQEFETAHGTVAIVTGLPVDSTEATLRSLDATMLAVSTGGLLAMGLAGTVLVRRSLRPLERVSAVAGSVAELPLDAGTVRLAQRVPPEDSHPGTEAGNVGHALNALLDNVSSALEARQQSEEKMRRFVSDASHELRTPLTAVRGYAELVAATEHLSEDGRLSLGRVVEQSRRMGALVENLLLLARLDEGRRAAPADVDLTALVLEAAGDFRVAAPGHEWRIRLPSAPVVVRGDASQLGRVLDNLMGNARKHTPDGTVVETSLRRSADGAEAILAVADSGEGIDPEFLPRVFERFARADAARSGAEETTGLGLPIVKAIVEAHGGSIGVASQPGRTEFTVRLPLAVPAPPKPPLPPTPAKPPTAR